jgi:hypothetical protein
VPARATDDDRKSRKGKEIPREQFERVHAMMVVASFRMREWVQARVARACGGGWSTASSTTTGRYNAIHRKLNIVDDSNT